MVPLRLIPIFAVLGCTQLGIYLALRALFFPHQEQKLGRRLTAGFIAVAGLSLPLYGVLIRNGVQLAPWLRYGLAYPLLSWNVMAIPLLLLIGLALSVARRWPRRSGPAAGRAPAEAAVDSGRFENGPLDPALAEPRRVFLARGALGLLGGAALASFAGANEAESEPLVTRRDVFLPGLHPDLDGLSVLQLSDIHSGSLVTEERMSRWAASAAALGADLVVITGDLLDGSGRAAAPFSRAFSGLHGKLGTYAILGNHDYYAGERFAARAVRDAGHVLLKNAGVRISRGNGSLWLGGVDDPIGEVDADRALRGAAPGEPKLMLAHRPGLFSTCAAAGADLVLSGHTHGGQIAFSRRFSPARLIGRYVMGPYSEGKAQLYVHRGMGTVGAVPLRLGSPPELALLTLRRS